MVQWSSPEFASDFLNATAGVCVDPVGVSVGKMVALSGARV